MKTAPMEKMRESYRACFTTPAGIQVLADLRAAYYDVPLSRAQNPHQMAVAVGQHSVVTSILELLEETQ